MSKPPALLACIFGVMLLGGCSYIYTVEVRFVGDKLAFFSEDDEETNAPFCLISFRVSDESGAAIWEFDAYEAYRNASKCGPNFPLIYGQAPKGAKILTPPRPLKSGALYTIEGSAGNMLEGSFRYYERRVMSIKNLDVKLPEVQAARERQWARQKTDH